MFAGVPSDGKKSSVRGTLSDAGRSSPGQSVQVGGSGRANPSVGSSLQRQVSSLNGWAELRLHASVYDEAFLCLLLRKHGFMIRRSSVIRVWVFLFLTCFVQGMVVVQLRNINHDLFYNDFSDIYGDPQVAWWPFMTSSFPETTTGLCTPVSAALQSFLAPGTDPPGDQGGKLISCLPDDVLLTSRFSQLDLDGDGLWTLREARELSAGYERATGRSVDLAEVYVRTLAAARQAAAHEGLLVARGGIRGSSALPNVTLDELTLATNTSGERCAGRPLTEELQCLAEQSHMPRDLYEGEVQSVSLPCLLLDSHLCGNALLSEAWPSPALAAHLDSLQAQGLRLLLMPAEFLVGPGSMLRHCEAAVNEICPHLFTDFFRLWASRKDEICGTRKTSFSRSAFQQVVYGYSEVYNGADGAMTPGFRFFLGVMLFLWAMASVGTVENLCSWWRVLPAMASECTVDSGGTPQLSDSEPWSVHLRSGQAFVEVTARHVKVNAMLRRDKALIIVLNMLPRTILELWLLWEGVWFLTTVQQHRDLILNTLTLAFVVTIDRMIFAAFANEEHKKCIRDCVPLQPQGGCCFAPFRWALQCMAKFDVWDDFREKPPFFPLAILLAVGVSLWTYSGDYGVPNRAATLQCLCQAEGERCLTRRILGSIAERQGGGA